MEDNDDNNPTNLQQKTSVHIEEINNDDDTYPHNVAPLNSSHLLELSDGSDDEEGIEPALIEVDDDDKDEEEPEESAEAELGQSWFLLGIV